MKKKISKPEPPRLLLACGDVVLFRDGEIPLCPTHGMQRIVRTVGMPPPRIVGMATGPHVQQQDLGAFTGRIAGNEKP